MARLTLQAAVLFSFCLSFRSAAEESAVVLPLLPVIPELQPWASLDQQ
jgi:hypothetical protein